MVLYVEGDRNLLAVRVDPSDASAWRRDPYYRQLKEFAVKNADGKYRVIVYVKNRVIVILPNKDLDLGMMQPGDQLLIRETRGPNGRDWNAVLEPGRQSAAGLESHH
jgi:hypothetical protein